MSYASQFISMFLFTFLALFPIVNPVGMSLIFLSMTKTLAANDRRELATRIAKYSAILLIVVLFCGAAILRFFGVSLDYIRVAGGLLVAWSAWRSLNNSASDNEENYAKNSPTGAAIKEMAFFPLTMPITTGPGAIAVTVALDTRIVEKFSVLGAIEYLAIILSILLVSALIWICYSFSENLLRLLGETGAKAITSLSSFIILAIGVEIFWQGLAPLLTQMMMPFYS